MGREPDEVARQSGPDGLVRSVTSRRTRLVAARDTPEYVNGPMGHTTRRPWTRAGADGPARAARAGPGRTADPARDMSSCALAPARRAAQDDVSYGNSGRAVVENLKSESPGAREGGRQGPRANTWRRPGWSDTTGRPRAKARCDQPAWWPTSGSRSASVEAYGPAPPSVGTETSESGVRIRVVRCMRSKGAVRGQEPIPGAAPEGQTSMEG